MTSTSCQLQPGLLVGGIGFPKTDVILPVPDYMDENVSDKVVRIVQSYVGVVNKMVV